MYSIAEYVKVHMHFEEKICICWKKKEVNGHWTCNFGAIYKW